MDAFLTGVVAGYGIAIPVGAIAVLIMDIGIRRGFRPAFAAGAGAATADFTYAGLAVIGGAALASAIASIDDVLHLVSGLVLLVIALAGLFGARRRSNEAVTPDEGSNDLIRTYARFVGLTIINPTTVVYFAAVVIGLGVAEEMPPGDGLLFVTGAFLASLSWQTMLAAVSAIVGHRLSPAARSGLSILGNLVILVFGLVVLFG
jgi:threonine/homoserine/homoserine lactone efflux protein